jgi:hypothetical protein
LKSHKQKDLQLVTQGKKKLEDILSVNESRKLDSIPEDSKGEGEGEDEDYSKFEELD